MPAEEEKTAVSAGISSADAAPLFERLKEEVRRSPYQPSGGRRASTPLSARDEAERLWSVAVDRPIRHRPGIRGLLLHPIKRILRKLMSWYVGPFAAEQRSFNAALLRLADQVSEATDELRAGPTVEAAERASDAAELESRLKGELVSPLLSALAESTRLVAELEQRLLRLERRERSPGTVAAQPRADAVPDYFAFEVRMRGDSAEIRDRQQVYVDDFRRSAPVLDLGCGRGEFLSLLREAGVEARGVDADADMVAYARGEGLDVEQADAVAALEALVDESLGGIFAAQLLEHLPPPTLLRLLELSAAKLRPGGLFVAETINPLSPLALRNYFADLTHAQPLVAETRELLLRQAGFSSVEKRFLNEPDRKLTEPPDPVIAANVRRLNELLFAPLDYALVARTPVDG